MPREPALGEMAAMYGQGLGLRETGMQARQGPLRRFDDRRFGADFLVSDDDSGSPVIDAASGEAIGIVTAWVGELESPTIGDGPTLQRSLELAEEAGFQLELVTAPLRHESGPPYDGESVENTCGVALASSCRPSPLTAADRTTGSLSVGVAAVALAPPPFPPPPPGPFCSEASGSAVIEAIHEPRPGGEVTYSFVIDILHASRPVGCGDTFLDARACGANGCSIDSLTCGPRAMNPYTLTLVVTLSALQHEGKPVDLSVTLSWFARACTTALLPSEDSVNAQARVVSITATEEE